MFVLNNDTTDVIMETYPLIDQRSDRPFAFEIDIVFVGTRMIAKLLRQIDGISDVRQRDLFRGSSEIPIEFKYLNHDYIVWESYGDSSRYWIGPKNPQNSAGDIGNVEDVFKRYRPPFHRRALGEILTLRILKYLLGRK